MRVVALWRFPVKSLGGETLASIDVGDLGFAGDRQWAIQSVETGKVLTARREPKLLYGSARVVDGDVVIDTPIGSGVDGSALSEWLGYPVRLVHAQRGHHATYETPVDFEHEDRSRWLEWDGPDGVFHDSTRTRVSLVSAETLGAWDPRRFRTNVIVDDGPEDELIGHSVKIGSAGLAVVKPVDRCVMTTRPQPGIARDLDVLRTINRERAGNLAVGCLVVTAGVIEIGDDVTALE